MLWTWKLKNGKNFVNSQKKASNPDQISPWLSTMTKSTSLEAKIMTPNIISYANITLTQKPSKIFKPISTSNHLLEAVTPPAFIKIICLFLEEPQESLIKETIFSFLISRTTSGKDIGLTNSLNSTKIILLLKMMYSPNPSKSHVPIPSPKKWSAPILPPTTKNPLLKPKNFKTPISIHHHKKNTEIPWNNKITTTKIIPFMEIDKDFWETNKERTICWLICKRKPKKTLGTIMELWQKMAVKWNCTCLKHSSLWTIQS